MGTEVTTTERTGDRSADEVRARLAELRHDFNELPAYETRSGEDSSRVARMISEVNELDTELTAILALERRENASLVSTLGMAHGGIEFRSGGQRIVESDEFKQWVHEGCPERGFGVRLDCGIDSFRPMETRAGLLTDWAAGGPPNFDSSGTGNLLPVGQPIPPIPRQAKLYLRDLIPKMSTTLAAVPYVQELNPTSNEAASAVAEGGAKPGASIAFQGAKADPTVIAATLTLSKQLFEDAPLVVQYVNNRLPYIVKFKEDWEFINGSGTWPDITGIYNTSGILSQAAIAAEYAITLGDAFAQVENHDGEVTAVVMNPTDAWAMFTKRAAGGSGTFDAGTPFSALPLTVWGVPTYRTRAKAPGNALVADFARGATIVDREQVNVQTYRERYAELNEILLICEERVGLMVQRPDLFCSTALA